MCRAPCSCQTPHEYDGGELVVVTPLARMRSSCLRATRCCTPAPACTRSCRSHAGQRVACFFWVESMVRSDEQRRLLYDMDMALMQLRQAARRQPCHGDADRHVPQPAATVGRHMSTPRTPSQRSRPCLGPGDAGRPRSARPHHLDDNAWAYFSGGAGDEITLRANRAAWDRLQPCCRACCSR
jgi:hypothetical protein